LKIENLALRRLQFHHTGTHTLFCQIATSPNGRATVERQFSVAPSFLLGGTEQCVSLLSPAIQFSLQQQLQQLNTTSDGVARILWAMSSCSFIYSRNFGFMLQCLPTARMLAADKDALGTSHRIPRVLRRNTDLLNPPGFASQTGPETDDALPPS
jgi:hypothetical protein